MGAIGNIAVLILVVSVLAVSGCIFQESNQPPVTLQPVQNITAGVTGNITSYPQGDLQFFPNMKFNHDSITYTIDSSCSLDKKQRMVDAISELRQNVPQLSFTETANGSIAIVCDEKKIPAESGRGRERMFIAGEGGPTYANTSLFYVIESGSILLTYQQPACSDAHIVELHELLHVFGFQHSQDNRSIMYPVAYCNQALTADITSELKRLYNIENLPELAFSNISATKSGAYLDFNAEVKNYGLMDASNAKLNVYADGNQVGNFDLDTITYGGGQALSVQNLKIPTTTKTVKFEIADGREISTSNNVAEFGLK